MGILNLSAEQTRRIGVIAAQAGLCALLLALVLGTSYAIVCLIYGDSVLTPLVPVSLSVPQTGEEPGITDAPYLSTQIWEVPGGVSEERAWNIPTPLDGARGAVTAGDPRLLSAPVNGRLSDDYFCDALFIGDSVTQGFGLYEPYSGWLQVCAYKDASPRSILQNLVGQRPDGSEIEMWDEIHIQQKVSNIYILMGADALLQQSDEEFLRDYSELLDRLIQRFPSIPIYVQSLTPTTRERGLEQPPLAQEHLREINRAVARMSAEKGLIYLDLWEALADADGYLRAELTEDGLLLRGSEEYRVWLDYAAAHTVYSAHNAAFALAEFGVYG